MRGKERAKMRSRDKRAHTNLAGRVNLKDGDKMFRTDSRFVTLPIRFNICLNELLHKFAINVT